jgi:hypothetical protein
MRFADLISPDIELWLDFSEKRRRRERHGTTLSV